MPLRSVLFRVWGGGWGRWGAGGGGRGKGGGRGGGGGGGAGGGGGGGRGGGGAGVGEARGTRGGRGSRWRGGDGGRALMAAASGLHLLKPEQYNPMETTTYGTGELLRAAVESGVKKIILGIGGSATTDAGLGCLQACISGDNADEERPPITGRTMVASKF